MIIKDDIELEIVFSKEEKTVYIGTPSSSGTKYKCETIGDLKNSIKVWVNTKPFYNSPKLFLETT